jgi:2-polyprenyl-6-methoxyphenol hydroxylase-like FAD-dependent oxidoreductase
MNMPKVVIVGAGIGGLTAATALRAKGIDVEIYEARDRQRLTGTALGLASNATKVLRTLGIDLGTGDCGRALECFDVRTARGKLIRSLPVRAIVAELGDPVVSNDRDDLMRTLQTAAGDVSIRYGAEVVKIDIGDAGVRVTCADGQMTDTDLLIGADGIRSIVQTTLSGESPPTEYGYVCWLATTPFSHSRMVRGYCGHYWGAGQRFGLIDIGAGRAYWWGTKNMPAARAREWCGGKSEILAAFDGWAHEVTAVIERTPEPEIVSVPAQDRPFLDRWGSGPVSLIGDAAHPMLTSLGQGASSAIEDGYVLAEALASVPEPVAALRRYEDLRRDRTRMLVRTSRFVSQLEQVENPAVRAVRRVGVRCAPTRILKRRSIRPMRFDLRVCSRLLPRYDAR